MKKLILLLAITITGLKAQAETVLGALVDINDRWAFETNAWANLADVPNSYSETELIQKHLFLVHQELKSRDVDHLSEIEKQNRTSSLEDLKEYAERGLFPQNITHQGRRPIFIDGRGVHCAVGYLIKESGHPELSRHISLNMNDAYVLDMHDQYLSEWVELSGFTPQELAWIQPGYFQPIDYEPLKGGVNGAVNTIISDNNAGIFAGGVFDSADGMKAGGFANYFSGFAGYDWTSMGGVGFQGEVFDAIMYHGELYVAGNFYMVDTTIVNSGVVKWDGTSWSVVGDFYTGALFNYVLDLEIYEDTLYAGGFFKSKFTAPEVFNALAKWDGTEWRGTALDLYGEVRALHVYNNKLVVGGVFQLNDTAGVENIAMLNGREAEYFDESVKVPIHDIEDYGNEIFIATEFYNQSRQDSLGLGVYRNGSWETVFGPQAGFNNTGGVKCLASHPNALLVGGDFDIIPLMGNYGKNIGVYRGGYLDAFGMLDSTVRTMTIINDQLYIGGDFNGATTSTGGVTLNHIAQLHLPDYISVEEVKGASIEVYPNPSSGILTISGFNEPIDQVKIIDVKGAVFQPNYESEGHDLKLDLSALKPGVYVLQAKVGKHYYQEKITINRY